MKGRSMEIGFYFRIERNGKFQAIDICELTDDELDLILSGERSNQWLKAAVKILAKWIRDNVKEMPDDFDKLQMDDFQISRT